MGLTLLIEVAEVDVAHEAVPPFADETNPSSVTGPGRPGLTLVAINCQFMMFACRGVQ
jgi:hypothetical protein